MKLTGLQLQWFSVYREAVDYMHKIVRGGEMGHFCILVYDDYKALLYQKYDYRMHRALRSLLGGICVNAIDVGAGKDITEFENKQFMARRRKQGVRAIKMLKGEIV